ncbi:TetR/AcrR family transcriptional regulator [Saccharopolyspora rhizosphaerae]|uniref:TetR/AcrR family transcriptional regulator n=1 Tax=Saccharopolyspora rhizosphaerae TaxID=2492662 RepID=A0A3R8R390_9PSEU|nr:TetR/AcrR family transcriptional regulator [Saccharopolyspora rhizosphaerae]RRO17238.1 TetR/AcrR family transcriptional regulator [Saccharopolyspora rhizosphaerae]
MNAATSRANATKERILDVAERLFAEQGVFAVSNRQISEAAGQGNNAAVGYHFGTKADLLRAIVSRHSEPIEVRRQQLVAECDDSREVRDWLACLVLPSVEHHASLRGSTLARFTAQLMSDPSLRELVVAEALTGPTLMRIMDGLNDCLPELPLRAKIVRNDMTRHVLVHMMAEQERALAEGTARLTWEETAQNVIDALTGLWLAPVAE